MQKLRNLTLPNLLEKMCIHHMSLVLLIEDTLVVYLYSRGGYSLALPPSGLVQHRCHPELLLALHTRQNSCMRWNLL